MAEYFRAKQDVEGDAFLIHVVPEPGEKGVFRRVSRVHYKAWSEVGPLFGTVSCTPHWWIYRSHSGSVIYVPRSAYHYEKGVPVR